MAGLYDIVDAISAMGAEMRAVTADAAEATREVERLNQVSAGRTDASPNRDRSRDRSVTDGSSDSGSGKTGVTTTGLAAALNSMRGRT